MQRLFRRRILHGRVRRNGRRARDAANNGVVALQPRCLNGNGLPAEWNANAAVTIGAQNRDPPLAVPFEHLW